MNVICDFFFCEISLLIGYIKIYFSETYSHLIMQQCVTAETNIEKYVPIKKNSCILF